MCPQETLQAGERILYMVPVRAPQVSIVHEGAPRLGWWWPSVGSQKRLCLPSCCFQLVCDPGEQYWTVRPSLSDPVGLRDGRDRVPHRNVEPAMLATDPVWLVAMDLFPGFQERQPGPGFPMVAPGACRLLSCRPLGSQPCPPWFLATRSQAPGSGFRV